MMEALGVGLVVVGQQGWVAAIGREVDMRWCIKSLHMSSGKGNNVGRADDKGIFVMEIVGNGMGDTYVDTVVH